MSVDLNTVDFGCFDFGLTPKEETRAQNIHEKSIIVDMLFWGPATYLSYSEEMEKELNALWEATRDPSRCFNAALLQPVDMALRGELPEFKAAWDASGITAGSRDVDGFASLDEFATWFGIVTAQFDRMPWLIKALRAQDIRRAKAEGKHAGFINTQLSLPVGANFLDLLKPAYQLGLRMLQLTYNSMTIIGSGCMDRSDGGVSSYGAQVIARLNELGIIVDVGHCGKQTTLDACALSATPVVASHTTAAGVYEHPRGKSDIELRAIAATGGVIGVVALPYFLAPGKGLTIDVMLDHIDYIVNLVGWQHVGIGTDWPLAMPKSLLGDVFLAFVSQLGPRPEGSVDSTTNLIGFDDYRDFPNITRGLVKRGYGDEQIQGILGENFLRVFEQVCG